MSQFDDEGYLSYQYSDAEKYLIRVETHRDYSENPGDFVEWVIDRLAPTPGDLVLDVGCGPGIYHGRLFSRGAMVVGTDLFDGMLRERRNQAAARCRGICATAEALPLRSAAVRHAMANHMLYHVTRQGVALEELRRVVAPGGTVVLATNAADNIRRLHELHSLACRDAGLTSTSDETPSRFTLDDLSLVRSVFPNAIVETRPDALVFRDTEPVLRYYATFIIDYVAPLPHDGSHRPLLLKAMRRRVDEIIDGEGALHIPKDAGCFVASA
jgi:SAM-dependent methyltransferase